MLRGDRVTQVQTRATAVPQAALEAAVDWMVLLRSGDASEADRARLEAWRAECPAHAAAWQRVAGTLGSTLGTIRSSGYGRVAEQALLSPRGAARRRVLGGGLAMAAVAVGGGFVAARQSGWPALTADLATGVAERRGFDLPDGSRATLNACSAADVRFSDRQRALVLRRGELIVQVAAEATRPFFVETRHGTARALGTRFLVRVTPQRSLVSVLEHRVRVEALAGPPVVVEAGQSVWMSAAGLDDIHHDDAHAAWGDGMLVARDLSLGDVVDQLRPYRRGLIRLSAEAARLRVLGAFPLDDADAVLESLAQTLPIRVKRYGGWLVTIESA